MLRYRLYLRSAAIILAVTLVLSASLSLADGGSRIVCDIWPPYQIKTATGVTGMSVEIVEAVYRRLGVPIKDIRAYPWKRAMDAIRFDEAEALFSANYTDERAVFLNYPEEPLFESPWMVWTRAGSSILSLEDLKGKKVGVVLGYSYTPDFWDFIATYCTVEPVHSDDINFKKLSLGRLDATVAEYGNGLAHARAMGNTGIRPVPRITIKKDGLFIVFNKNGPSKDFVQRFSDELKAFKQTDEHRLIREKYLGAGE